MSWPGEAGFAAPLAFVVAAIVAGLTGLSYASPSSRLVEAGGEVVCADAALGQQSFSGAVGWLVALTGIVWQVIVPVPDAVASVLLFSGPAALYVRGIRASACVAAGPTLLSVAALLWIHAMRFEVLADLPRVFEAARVPSMGWLSVLGAAFAAFYASIGFEDMVNVAEGVRRPERDLSLARVAGRGKSDPWLTAAGLVSVTNSALAQTVV